MSFAHDLDSLRGGSLTFDTFARRHDARFRKWASYYFERWPQRALCIDDLVQEARLEAWRAVDSFDPTRGVTLERYVEYQIGKRLRLELERVLGWPKKSRGTKAVRPVSLQTPVPTHRGDPEHTPTIMDRLTSNDLSPEDLALATSVAETVPDEFDRDVIVGVARGMSPAVIASYVYEDPERRLRYRLDSVEHTARMIPGRVRRLAASIH